ncbi:MAG: hypothetical protein GY714_32775 [Desulfobacterales bacterium]|nr:hypothetical protein [Desulfobacterales bacterium]
MKKFLKFLLFIIIWIVIAALITFGAVLLDQPASTGLYISLFLFIFWIVFKTLKKIIVQYNAKKRVQNLINTEDPEYKSKRSGFLTSLFSFQSSDNMSRRFKKLLETLKKSELRKKGDPLSVLPWFLIMGPSKSGKTSSFQYGKMEAPSFDDMATQSDGYNWLLYNKGIVIDTPDIDFSSVDNISKKEWNTLLSLLRKQKSSEPLNGIVVTVSYDKLNNSDESHLYDIGKTYQARITETMKLLKVRVPVYILVTKCDLMEGFEQWCEILPTSSLDQPMGFAVKEEIDDIPSMVTESIDSIVSHVKDLILKGIQSDTKNEKLLRLPGGIDKLKEKLISFGAGIFQNNPYQESPIARGIYLSGISSENLINKDQRTGLFLKQFYNNILPADRKMISTLSSAEKAEALTKKYIMGGWSVAFIALILLLSSVYFSNISYLEKIVKESAGQFVEKSDLNQNIKTMNNLKEMIRDVDDETGSWLTPWFEIGEKPVFMQKMEKIYVERFKKDILLDLDKLYFEKISFKRGAENRSLVMGGYSLQVASTQDLNKAKKLVSSLKTENHAAFYTGPDNNRWYRVCFDKFKTRREANEKLVNLNNNGFDRELIVIKVNTPLKVKPKAAVFVKKNAKIIKSLIKRINILSSFIRGADFDDVSELPDAFEDDTFNSYNKSIVNDISALNKLYIQYLFWSKERSGFENKLKELKDLLVNLLKSNKNEFSWLISLANDQVKKGELYNIASFWPGSGRISPEIKIPGAFTLEGKAYIDDFIDKLVLSLPDSQHLKTMKSSFNKMYLKEYLKAWEQFALNFSNGSGSLQNRQEWIDMIDLIASSKNPFFRAMNLMISEIKPLEELKEKPEWLELLLTYDKFLAFGPDTGVDNSKRNKTLSKMALKTISKLGPVGKSIAGLGKSGMKTKKKLGGKGKTSAERDLVLEDAGKALGEYVKALQEVSFSSASRTVSFASMVNYFSKPDNPGSGEGPEARAYKSIHTLKILIGKDNRHNKAFWKLYSGSLDFVYDYLVKEASCDLQKKWTENFLVEIEGVPEYKLKDLMFGGSGKIWEFLNGDAAPFIKKRYGKGFVPSIIKGRVIPFKTNFINYISRGRDQQQSKEGSYPVLIKSLPVSANRDALSQPSSVTLTLDTPNKAQTLKHFNYTASKTFKWNDKCGDVHLAIQVASMTLKKRYTGAGAFIKFLKDFRYGSQRLLPKDFPKYKKTLENLKIEFIDIQFKLSGHEQVISSQGKIPSLQPPKSIISCWSNY